MPDVFINYRTGDEESAAALIERDLSARFGPEKVFRASRSIQAGETFPQRILGAVHGSRALLAIIGTRWADKRDANGRQLLANRDDWVRRELVEARKLDVRVIPVLIGDPAPRLDRIELPAALSWLRDLQYRKFSTRNAQADLDRIADDLAGFVPGLKPRPTGEQSGAHTVHGDVISGNHGPVQIRSRDQFNGPYITGRGDSR
jgi:hypothetical protein